MESKIKSEVSILGVRMPSLVLVFFVMDLALPAIYFFNYLAGERFEFVNKLLDIDRENSIGAWYSSCQLFLIGFFAVYFAVQKFAWKEKLSWPLVFLPLMFFFLSMDESVQIHEWLGKKSDALMPGGTRAGTVFRHTGIWMFVIGLPFFACFIVFALSIRKYFAFVPGAFTKLLVGMTVLLLGALGFEGLSSVFSDDLNSVMYRLIVICEETFEMVGATIMLWGVYDLVAPAAAGAGVELDAVRKASIVEKH